jgi:MFS family permease
MQVTDGADHEAWPRPAIAWYAVAILVVAFIFSFIDRIIISLLVTPLKQDLGLSDGDIGLLAGPAFAVFYTLVGIPIGRLADRRSRRALISVGIALWSVMTAACGLARNFGELFLARVGVGVGEAALSPAAYSMIADLFPRERLGRAVGVYQAGAFFGAGLAFLAGGLVIRAVTTADGGFSVPLLGELRPWQVVFIAVGLPGILVSALMWTVAEPRRRGARPASAMPFAQVLRFMAGNWRVYGLHFTGFALLAMPITVIATWSPAYFGRVLGYTPPQAGLTLGLILLTLSPLGVYLGGWVADLLQQRGYRDGTLRVGLAAAVPLLPVSVMATLNTAPELGVVLFCPLIFLASLSMAVAPAALQVVTPNPLRAQVSATWMLVLNLITAVLGAWAVGFLTDNLFGDEMAVGRSMALVNGISIPLAAIALWFARRPFAAASEASAGA